MFTRNISFVSLLFLCRDRKFGEGILVDDEEQNRKAWDLGLTVDANKDIISLLKTITR